MNREQMIAWLTLEGYIGQKSAYWNGLHSTTGALTCMYLDARRGIENPDGPVTYANSAKPLDCLSVPFEELPDLELLVAKITKEED